MSVRMKGDYEIMTKPRVCGGGRNHCAEALSPELAARCTLPSVTAPQDPEHKEDVGGIIGKAHACHSSIKGSNL